MKSTTEKLIAHKKDHRLSIKHTLMYTRIVCDDCGNTWSSKWDRPINMLVCLFASTSIVILIASGALRFWLSIDNDVLSLLVYVIFALPLYFLVHILLNGLHAALLRRSKDLSAHMDELV